MSFRVNSLLSCLSLCLGLCTLVIADRYSVASSTPVTSDSPTATQTVPYTILSYRDDVTLARIDQLPWRASGFNLYLGGQTTTYCPSTSSPCSGVIDTAFTGNGTLDSTVAGGQVVYAAPDGHLGYTKAHSNDYPAGSVPNPFILGRPSGTNATWLTTGVFGGQAFLGCPADESPGVYQIYANFPNVIVSGNFSNCISFQGKAYNHHGPQPYQYL